MALEAFEVARDDVAYGVLHGPTGNYPIVAGIPVLRGGDEKVVDHLRSGDLATAEALAVVRDLPLSRLDALGPALADLRPTRALARRLAVRRDRAATARATEALTASVTDPDPLLQLAMVDHRKPNVEGYTYFRYRFGLPRHLVALSAMSAARPGPEPIVEIGCGAGHLTWQIAELQAPRPVIAIERELSLLWIARRHLAPDAGFVCADATALPLATASCSLGVAVDVLSFITAKATAVRELQRVVTPAGGLLLTSLINALAEHEYRGEPLAPQQWSGLIDGLEHRVYDDDELLDRYLAGRGPASEESSGPIASRTITMLAGDATLAGTGTSFEGWPHATGRLGPHPLLAPVADASPGQGDEIILQARPPSPGFMRDNPGLQRYLPAEVRMDPNVIDDVREGRASPAVDALVAGVILLGYPGGPGFDPWPRIGR